MYLRRRFPAIAPNLSTKACQTYGYMLRTIVHVAQTVQPYRLGEDGSIAEPLLCTGNTLACPLFPGITAQVAHPVP